MTFHVRLVSLPDRTNDLVEALAADVGVSAAMIVTLLFALAVRWSGHTPKLYSLGVRPVSSLIDSPNLFSIVVAVLAGIVGVVCRPKHEPAPLSASSSR